MANERTDGTGRRRRWAAATCVALVLAAVGDAGPEIIGSGSLIAGYDGPGPLIDLALAALVATVRWRFAPLVAATASALFLAGGFADTDFTSRLAHPSGAASGGAWLQVLGFAAAIACGLAAVRRRRTGSTVNTTTSRRP